MDCNCHCEERKWWLSRSGGIFQQVMMLVRCKVGGCTGCTNAKVVVAIRVASSKHVNHTSHQNQDHHNCRRRREGNRSAIFRPLHS